MAAQLTKGQIDQLTVDELTVSVHHGEPVDVSALLLDASGRARGAGDLIFYNQPAGPGVRLVSGQSPGLSIALRQLPADVEHVRVTLTLEDPQAHFGDYDPPTVRIEGDGGRMVYEYVIDGLGREPTVIAFDLDRVGTAWQLRVLGHGYPAGFSELVTAHGVRVGAASEQQEYTGPAVLHPGQEISLRDIRPGELAKVNMALGWDPIRVQGPRGTRKLQIDLDASALLFIGHNLVDAAFFQQLSSRNGAVRHSGDNLTGEGQGDDEVITVDLTRLPQQVSAVVFVVTSYAGHTFERLRNAYWRLVDGTANAELARGNLRAGGAHTGMVVAKVTRDEGHWRLAAIGAPIQAGHPVEAVQQITPYL